MFPYSFVKWALILVAALIRETKVDYAYQIGGGTMAVTGYFAHRGVYEVQAIKKACYGNWRHARVEGLECPFALARTMAWHSFMIAVGVAGGTKAEYSIKYQGE